MTTSPVHYLGGAAILLLKSRSYDNTGNLKADLKENYGAELSDEHLTHTLSFLQGLRIVELIQDSYAGDFAVLPSPTVIELRLGNLRLSDPTNGIFHAMQHGGAILRNVFRSSQFWTDLEAEISETQTDEGSQRASTSTEIPASDRRVSISHNQFKEIDEPTGELIEQLEQDNGIPGEEGLKEQILGQIKAGRELLRAGEFQLAVFQITMLDGLRMLISKYGDHAIAAAASALLTLILHVLGLPGF